MRVFHISASAVSEHPEPPATLPEDGGFVWLALARREFEVLLPKIQATLQRLCGSELLGFHTSDLLNNQLPSHYDYTSAYDVLVFRRLATSQTEADILQPGQPVQQMSRSGLPPVLRHINTHPVGFAVFDRVLLSIHPADCSVRDEYATRLMNSFNRDDRSAMNRVPAEPADLMLRIVNHMVDGYLALRRELTRDFDRWQMKLLDERRRFTDWTSMLNTRVTLHQLDEICEDQRSAIQDWIEAIKTWSLPSSAEASRDRELLMVRSRDVLEHIERVIHHVGRLERSAETAVQMHCSVQGSRTNHTMTTLTVLTAIFLPLNLITGFFGMNFDALPLIHSHFGMELVLFLLALLPTALGIVAWRKRILAKRN